MRDIWLQLRGLASPSSPRTLCIGAYIEPCVRFHSILDIMRGGIRWKFMKGGVVYYHKFGVWLWYGYFFQDYTQQEIVPSQTPSPYVFQEVPRKIHPPGKAPPPQALPDPPQATTIRPSNNNFFLLVDLGENE